MTPELKNFHNAIKRGDHKVDLTGGTSQRDNALIELADWLYWYCCFRNGSQVPKEKDVTTALNFISTLRQKDWQDLVAELNSRTLLTRKDKRRQEEFDDWINTLDTIRAFE